MKIPLYQFSGSRTGRPKLTRTMSETQNNLTVLVRTAPIRSTTAGSLFLSAVASGTRPSCPCPVVLNTETRNHFEADMQLTCSNTQANDPPGSPRTCRGAIV